MRRMLVLSLALVALLGFVAPPDVFAQAAAPTPKVVISGLIDNVGTFTQNMSIYDLNWGRNRDQQVYGRTRGVFEIAGEVGQAKAVFRFEIDSTWGQTGFIDSNNGPGCAANASGAVTCGAVGNGSESSFDLNTDTQGNLQVKWLFVEFPMPLVPIPIIVRLGGQPFATAANYKLATYANGDFGGINLYATFSPTFKAQWTLVLLDENLTGKGSAFGPFATSSSGTTGLLQNKCIGNVAGVTTVLPASACQAQSRGDNFALIGSPEITVMKGLDIKPMISSLFINGLTSTSARQGRGGVSVSAGGPFAPTNAVNSNGSAGVAGADGAGTGIHESRYTVGLDARWRSGPWSVDPTILYQFGTQAKFNPGGVASAYGTAGTRQSADISAWLGDIRASYKLGPLLISGLTMFTTGQDAKSNPYKSIKYFTPLDTDTGYLNDWGTQITSLGVDYYQNMGATSAAGNMANQIGWDKYGRVAAGLRADYAITPSLTPWAAVTPNWTWSKVDTDAFLVSGGGLQPNFTCRKTGQNCRPEGESNYLGTEFDLGLTYRFAPGLTFDFAAGYLMSGNALAHRYVAGQYAAGANTPVGKDIGVNDVILVTTRVRLAF